MKLLVFSDLHADKQAAERLVEHGAAADLWIGAGDFGNLRRHVSDCLEVLGKPNRPAVLVPGNNESDEQLREAAQRHWPAARVLHGAGEELLGISIFGIGGGIPVTPFGSWSFDLDESQAELALASLPRGGLLVSHSPPKGHVDRDSRGRSLGSQAVRDAVERTAPRLVVCGHIHASAGQRSRCGNTLIVNAGPAGVLLDWPPQA